MVCAGGGRRENDEKGCGARGGRRVETESRRWVEWKGGRERKLTT